MAGGPVPISITTQPTSSHPAPGPARPAARPAPNPLLNPNQSLSGQALLQAAQQLANVQVNPALTELSKQIAANNAQTQGTINLTGGYYNQLEPYVQQGATQQGQIASGLNSTLTGIGNDTQSQLKGIGDNAQATLSKYAPQGDGGISNAATADLAAQIAKQQGLAAQQAGTYRAFGANQGANYQGLGTSQLGTYGLQGQEALKGIAQSGTVKNEPLMSKIAALQQQKGALTATDLGKLRQQEVANGVARAGLGLKSQALGVTAANDAAKISTARMGIKQRAATAEAGQDVTQHNQGIVNQLRQHSLDNTRQNNLANQRLKQEAINSRIAARSGAGAKPLSAVSNNLANTKIGEIGNAIDTWQQGGFKDKSGKVINAHPTLQQMQTVLGSKYDPTLVQAAVELETYGYISPQTAAGLRSMGVRGTTYNNAPVQVGQSKQRGTGAAVSRGGAAAPKGPLF